MTFEFFKRSVKGQTASGLTANYLVFARTKTITEVDLLIAFFVAVACKQVFLLGLVIVQLFVALQPARYYWYFIESLVPKSVGGFPKQPWLYVDLPVIGNGTTGENLNPNPVHPATSVATGGWGYSWRCLTWRGTLLPQPASLSVPEDNISIDCSMYIRISCIARCLPDSWCLYRVDRCSHSACLPSFALPPGSVRTLGLFVALAPIIWFFSFTVLVIAAKWLAVGTQAQCRIPLGTHAYLSWWYVNAMLNVWETVGGRWLVGTKLLILFYRAMGVKVGHSSTLLLLPSADGGTFWYVRVETDAQ